jgi:hypothetical protein
VGESETDEALGLLMMLRGNWPLATCKQAKRLIRSAMKIMLCCNLSRSIAEEGCLRCSEYDPRNVCDILSGYSM